MYAAFGFHVPFDQRMGLIADAGFDCTSLCWEHKNERARELKLAVPEIAREAGLEVESVHVPYSWCNDFWSEDDSIRDAVLGQHCEWVGG